MFLRNVWYAAAWASELKENLLGRRIAGEPVLFFRREGGEVVAMGDRCPHRFAPLSRGRREGDGVRCAYHGLVFDASGRCVANPIGRGEAPKAAAVPVYPAAERHGLLWVWLGDREKADRAAIPELGHVVLDGAEPFREGYLPIRADYRLALDNLMDLSHAAILHDETLGPLTPALAGGELHVSRNGDRIKASIEMRNVQLGEHGRFDQWLETEWSPSGVIVLTLVQTAPATPPGENDRRYALHIISPETERTCHYLFGSVIDTRASFVRDPFADEDEPMLAACQAMMGEADFWSLRPVVLPNDAGAIQVRRHLERMIRAEQEG